MQNVNHKLLFYILFIKKRKKDKQKLLLKIILKKSERKAKVRNLYIQVPHLTRNTIWESDKNTSKHNIQESQEVSPFPLGDHKAARNIQDSITKTKMRHTGVIQ